MDVSKRNAIFSSIIDMLCNEKIWRRNFKLEDGEITGYRRCKAVLLS